MLIGSCSVEERSHMIAWFWTDGSCRRSRMISWFWPDGKCSTKSPTDMSLLKSLSHCLRVIHGICKAIFNHIKAHYFVTGCCWPGFFLRIVAHRAAHMSRGGDEFSVHGSARLGWCCLKSRQLKCGAEQSGRRIVMHFQVTMGGLCCVGLRRSVGVDYFRAWEGRYMGKNSLRM